MVKRRVTKKSGFLKRLWNGCVVSSFCRSEHSGESVKGNGLQRERRPDSRYSSDSINQLKSTRFNQYGLEMRGQVTGSVDIKVEKKRGKSRHIKAVGEDARTERKKESMVFN